MLQVFLPLSLHIFISYFSSNTFHHVPYRTGMLKSRLLKNSPHFKYRRHRHRNYTGLVRQDTRCLGLLEACVAKNLRHHFHIQPYRQWLSSFPNRSLSKTLTTQLLLMFGSSLRSRAWPISRTSEMAG